MMAFTSQNLVRLFILSIPYLSHLTVTKLIRRQPSDRVPSEKERFDWKSPLFLKGLLGLRRRRIYTQALKYFSEFFGLQSDV